MLISEWTGFWSWNANSITVSRMQDKIVETADGAMHVLLNEGPFTGLTLRTSYDNGTTWTKSYRFEETGRFSTGHLDMRPDRDTLTVSYQDDRGEVLFQTLDYDPAQTSWSASMDPSVAIEGIATGRISLPNHVEDADGTLYAIGIQSNLLAPKLTLSVSTDGGASWSAETERFSEYDAVSARLVSTPDVTGVLVATDTDMLWLDPSSDTPLVEISDMGSYQIFASHYSVTVVGNDIYLANVTEEEDPQVEFFVFDGDTQTWSDRISPEHTFDAEAYVQLSSNPEGHLYMTFDEIGTGLVRVLESVDGGLSWEIETDIVVESGVEPGFTRMVAPEYFTEDLVVFQMVMPRPDSNYRGVSVAVVDVNDDGSTVENAPSSDGETSVIREWVKDQWADWRADRDESSALQDRFGEGRLEDWDAGSALASLVDGFDL